MNISRFFLPALLLLAFCGCTAPKKSAGGKALACEPISVPPVSWKTVKVEMAPDPKLPRKFNAYAVSQTEWSSYASKVKERGPKETTGLNVPLPSGCKRFSVTVSQTMSPELAAKYPDIISLKGSADDGSDLRLDWNGREMRGQVVSGSDTWFIEPYSSGVQTYSLIYHKNDASTTKRPFE